VWEQIRSNQIRSVVLTIGMGALLILIGYFLGLAFDSATAGLVIAILLWVILSLVAYFQGDSILLSMSRAKKIKPDDHPRLYNVVEEMKIASGLEKMPDIYIIDDPALNAFATGRDPNKASVAITSGLLQRLNRDELQGVMAHEISHVKNRDVLLMAMCGVLLGTIVILAWYGSRFLIFGGAGSRRSSSRGGGQGQIIILIVALVFMILAPIFAQLIYFAISRKREYLADASSALYTRYPEGLASALEKLAASTEQLKSANQATAPMYIINPFRKKGLKASDLTSTHPPISERIRILRAMAGASFNNYDQAYRQVHGGRGVMPAASLTAEAVPIATVKLEGEAGEVGEVQRARETSDVMWRLSNYKTITCDQISCPRCGRTHQV
jgi:heat shock protein HtpX